MSQKIEPLHDQEKLVKNFHKYLYQIMDNIPTDGAF